MLLQFVRSKDQDGFADYIEQLGAKFNQTKLPQYCQNNLINAALTVYLSRARELGIPVTASVDLPQDLPASGDLSIVLSNLVENALIASQKQKPTERSITVLALRQGPSLNILVKNRFDAPVPLNEEGLPVTHVKGHGIGMQSLARFRDKYDASVLCRQQGGFFMTYMQVPLSSLELQEEG
ncbi:MAG: GHKL domain-containing protein [Mitsuokella multacida]|jgi:sensor histidine kinase YesM